MKSLLKIFSVAAIWLMFLFLLQIKFERFDRLYYYSYFMQTEAVESQLLEASARESLAEARVRLDDGRGRHS